MLSRSYVDFMANLDLDCHNYAGLHASRPPLHKKYRKGKRKLLEDDALESQVEDEEREDTATRSPTTEGHGQGQETTPSRAGLEVGQSHMGEESWQDLESPPDTPTSGPPAHSGPSHYGQSSQANSGASPDHASLHVEQHSPGTGMTHKNWI